MPPKKGGKAKSPKLSKAEKERLKKEEAERKAREEEEARLQAEQEQREKEERERLEREEKERLAQQEREAHEAEVDELNGLLEDKYNQIKNSDGTNRENAQWARYMLCDGSPDPKVTKEINTYINLWREETDSKPVHKTIQECHDALKLIDELHYYLRDEPGLSEEDVEKHNESISHLQNLIRVKLDEATMHVLKSGDEHIDPDTQNIQFELTSRFIALNIWGNISRNPRMKSLAFEKKGIVLDIPKSLSVGNVAIRCIFTNYDHFSVKSRLFYPRAKIVPDVVVEPQPVVEITTETVDDGPKENENDHNSLAAPEPSTATLTPQPPSSSRGRKKSSNTKRASSRLSASVSTSGRKSRNKSARKTPVPSASVAGSEKTEETTDQDADVVESSTDKRTQPAKPTNGDAEFDEDDDDDVVDLRAFNTADKVIYMDLFELPPQPKVVKNWVMQHIVPPKLVTLPYVFGSKKNEDVTSSENDLANNDDTEQAADGSTDQTQKVNAGNAPIHVTLRLPADVSYFEQPQVARWEPSKNHWRLDGLSDIQFNDQTNMLRFKTDRFAPIAIFQDLYLNMPFQSWEIRPHGLNSCIFTIVAAAIDLEIEVKDSYCCVAHAEDSVQRLRHLRGKWMNPKDLIKRLKASGVNVFPSVDAEKYVSLNMKDSTLEKNIYEQMSLTASAFAYSWSRWNSDCGKEKIVIQATEQETDEPPMEDDWFIYMASNENSCKLKLSEFDETFSDDVAENTKLHADLYHMVMDGASDSAVTKVKETSFQFFNCVSQLLNATKVLTYS